MIRSTLYTLLISLSISLSAQAPAGGKWLIPADTVQPNRLIGVTTGMTATFGSAMLLLNEYWYKDYPRGSFRWFNDSREWLQMDKTGHVFNGYFMSHWITHMYQWSGVPNRKAAIIGGTASFIMMSSIEILDGYSLKWGASASDLLTNALGSGLAMSQELLWQEQRISLKISAWPQPYETALLPRTQQLFGNTVAELVLKDYNALTVWLSANPASFIQRDTWWPQWLNIAAGYGADGLFGGFENKWCTDGLSGIADCPPDRLVDRSDIPRIRQYYLSLDVDLSRIHSRKPWVRTLLGMANLVKIPAPALMVDGQGRVRFYPVFF